MFLKKIGDCDVCKGAEAKFIACATGYPEPSVEWFKNGQKLYPNSKIKMEADKNGLLRLTVRDVDEADVGKYSCRVYNSHGEDNCNAELLFECKCNQQKFFKINSIEFFS